jgi:hypothetical protein
MAENILSTTRVVKPSLALAGDQQCEESKAQDLQSQFIHGVWVLSLQKVWAISIMREEKNVNSSAQLIHPVCGYAATATRV